MNKFVEFTGVDKLEYLNENDLSSRLEVKRNRSFEIMTVEKVSAALNVTSAERMNVNPTDQ